MKTIIDQYGHEKGYQLQYIPPFKSYIIRFDDDGGMSKKDLEEDLRGYKKDLPDAQRSVDYYEVYKKTHPEDYDYASADGYERAQKNLRIATRGIAFCEKLISEIEEANSSL